MSTSRTPRRTAVLTRLAAASSLVVSLLVAPPALAHPDGCQAKAGEDVDEGCFTAPQIAEFDDSSAPLPTPGTTASSPNLRLLSNTPKTGIAAGETAFNSDLAFVDGCAIQGNDNGFSVWDVRRGGAPKLVSQASCLGAQNDVSAYGNTVITSTDSRRASAACDATSTTDTTNYWEGIRVWDISDKAKPRLLTSLATDCGSHTNTLVPDPANKQMLVYVSSYSQTTRSPTARPRTTRSASWPCPMSPPRPLRSSLSRCCSRTAASLVAAPLRARRSRTAATSAPPAAATTSRPTRPRGSRPVRAWARAC